MAVALFFMAALGGVVALPAARLGDVVWLVGAAGAASVLIISAPGVSRLLAGAVARRVGQLVVASVCIVLIQAMLRQPLALTLGGDPFVVEASFVGLAFALLLVVLSMLFQAARPVLEDVVLNALDAALATFATEEPAAAAVGATQPDAQATLAAPTAHMPTLRADDVNTEIADR